MKTKTALLTQQSKDTKIIDKPIHLAVETTISLIINETYRINLLCTCQQVEALSVGYLISEGLIQSFSDIEKIEYKQNNMIHVTVSSSVNNFFEWIEVRTSGCIGVSQQYEKMNTSIDSDLCITPEMIFSSLQKMNQLSNIWKISGGAHMSGLFRSDGTMVSYAEDVGRHNTLDKIIGEAIIKDENLSDVFVTTSGRISAAMVAKIARAGIPLIASISSPLDKGVEIAEQSNITVLGFARKPTINIYTHPERISINQ